MEDQRLYEIASTLLPEAGIKRSKDLIAYCGSAKAIFDATIDDFQQLPHLSLSIIRNILAGRDKALREAEQELKFIDSRQIQTCFYQSENYPYRLRECPDAPIVLYGKGNTDFNSGHIVSIVGTRMPTERGKDACQQLVKELAARLPKVTIVSGLAYGIDVTAHRAALEAGIPTLIIPGHGLDRIYPAVHRNVAVAALEHGGILTEYRSGTNPDRQNFVARNRIIAGLADATVVIESKTKGGSLITAEMANSYSRDVFAFPGRATDEVSAGCNQLIKEQKAGLIENANDLILAMQWDANPAKTAIQTALFDDLSAEEDKILQILRREPEGIHINLIVMETGLPYGDVSSTLLQLEFRGVAKALPGGIYLTLQ